MTLGDFFNALSQNPSIVIFYFVALPLTAFLAGVFGRGEGHISPWKFLYSVLVYLACVPGIFAITLSIYQFLFERQPVMETNLFTQVLPVLCMVLTLWLVRRNMDFKDIPGFGKLSGLMIILIALISLLWVAEKTRIFVISLVPFHYFVIFFIVLLIAVRYGWKKMAT